MLYINPKFSAVDKIKRKRISNPSDFFNQFKNSLGRILHCSLVEENVSNAKSHTLSVC